MLSKHDGAPASAMRDEAYRGRGIYSARYYFEILSKLIALLPRQTNLLRPSYVPDGIWTGEEMSFEWAVGVPQH